MCYQVSPMIRRLIVPTLVVLGLAACSGTPEPPATTTTTSTTQPPTAQDLIALENKPGATAPLTDAVEPAPPPVPGLPGTPETSPAYGPTTAAVYIYVLSDFQCPVCRRVVEPLKHLARAYPNDVRVIFKHNALASHGRAARLAAASIAAFRQGKFWAYHDRLFVDFGRDDDDTLVRNATDLGLDAAKFQRDMEEEAVTAQVKYETELAKHFGLESTPGFIVNGNAHAGWGSYMSLDGIVQRELARAKKVAESGVPADKVACESMRQSPGRGQELAQALCPAAK